MGECSTCQGRGDLYATSPHLPRSPEPVQCDDCQGTGTTLDHGEDDGLVENLKRLSRWARAQKPVSTIWLHADEAAARIEQDREIIRERDGHLRNMIALIEANQMPLSKDEYREVQAARAALTRKD